jgi:hypothetical protein
VYLYARPGGGVGPVPELGYGGLEFRGLDRLGKDDAQHGANRDASSSSYNAGFGTSARWVFDCASMT